MDNDEVIKKAEQDLSLAGEMGYKTCIQKLKDEIRQAYYEGWGDAIRETGEEFFSTDMENNWLESEAIKNTEALKGEK